MNRYLNMLVVLAAFSFPVTSLSAGHDDHADHAGEQHEVHKDDHEEVGHEAHKDEGHKDEGHADEGHADEGHGEEHADDNDHDEKSHGQHDTAAHAEQGEEAKGGHGGHEGHGDEAPAELVFTAAQMQASGIEVSELKALPLATEISAPGEVRLNAYQSAHVGPRIEAQIIARHARLGDWVEAGEPLVSLSSIDVSEAQGDFLVADREWRRVKKLGRKTISERRYIEARSARDQARARLISFGLSAAQIAKMPGAKQTGSGRFQLVAPLAGRIINDDFVLGEIVVPGRVLFEVSNERALWVEVRLQSEQAHDVKTGAAARVKIGQQWFPAEVIQVRHTLDEVTRTLGVRLSLANLDDHIHPGEFVIAQIAVDEGSKPEMVLPENAVLRSPDGDWQVFIEEAPGQFEAREVEVVRSLPGQMVIAGLAEGTRVVTAGAFFVQSEQAKSGFAVHNH